MGKNTRLRLVFPLHFFRALPLPACFTTEQSTVEASLFVKYKVVLTSFSMDEHLLVMLLIWFSKFCYVSF